MLVNTVHSPNWNKTLSQKIALNLCHFFAGFCLSFLSSLCPSENTDWELWIKKRGFVLFCFVFGSYCEQPVLPLPRALFPALPSTDSWHFQQLLWVGLWQLEPSRHFLGFVAPSPLLGSARGAGLISIGTSRSKKPTRNPAHSRTLQGPEEKTCR